MGTQAAHDVGIVLDSEIKTPVVVDARLPEAARFVVLLGPERWMAKVAQQVRQLLAESLLNLRWSGDERRGESFSDDCAHHRGA